MSCDPDALIQAARCFRCIPGLAQQWVKDYLLCQWANVPALFMTNVGAGRYTVNWDFINLNFGTDINTPVVRLTGIDADFFSNPIADMPKAAATAGVLTGFWFSITANLAVTLINVAALGPGYDLTIGGVQPGKNWSVANSPGPVDFVTLTGGAYPGYTGP